MKLLIYIIISQAIVYFIFSSVNGFDPTLWVGDWKSAYVATQIFAIICVVMCIVIADDNKKVR